MFKDVSYDRVCAYLTILCCFCYLTMLFEEEDQSIMAIFEIRVVFSIV